jgi:hypothetical protein
MLLIDGLEDFKVGITPSEGSLIARRDFPAEFVTESSGQALPRMTILLFNPPLLV